MDDEKIYSQADMDGRIQRELEVAKTEYDALAFRLRSEIRDLKNQCEYKDSIIKPLSVAVENLSKKGN